MLFVKKNIGIASDWLGDCAVSQSKNMFEYS